ncbi:hypothetical protein D3C86_1488280 [compost metagenome]
MLAVNGFHGFDVNIRSVRIRPRIDLFPFLYHFQHDFPTGISAFDRDFRFFQFLDPDREKLDVFNCSFVGDHYIGFPLNITGSVDDQEIFPVKKLQRVLSVFIRLSAEIRVVFNVYIGKRDRKFLFVKHCPA